MVRSPCYLACWSVSYYSHHCCTWHVSNHIILLSKTPENSRERHLTNFARSTWHRTRCHLLQHSYDHHFPSNIWIPCWLL